MCCSVDHMFESSPWTLSASSPAGYTWSPWLSVIAILLSNLCPLNCSYLSAATNVFQGQNCKCSQCYEKAISRLGPAYHYVRNNWSHQHVTREDTKFSVSSGPILDGSLSPPKVWGCNHIMFKGYHMYSTDTASKAWTPLHLESSHLLDSLGKVQKNGWTPLSPDCRKSHI